MPDLIDELRRYADAVEEAVPARDVPEVSRPRPWRSRAALAGVAAAVAVVAVWVSVAGDEAAIVDTAESSREAGPWEVQRVGVVDGAVSDHPVWFADRWWALTSGGGDLLSSTDGSSWDPLPFDPAIEVSSFGALAANDDHLLAVGTNDVGHVVAATTADGSNWEVEVVGDSGVPRGDLANFVAVAFDDTLGIAIRVPTDEGLEMILAQRRLDELVQDLAGPAPFGYQIDPATGVLQVTSDGGEEIFSGSPLELGLTETELRHVITTLTSADTADRHDWRLHLTENGASWDLADLPRSARDAEGLNPSGRALTSVNIEEADTLTTVDGRSWTPVDLSAISMQYGHSSGGAFHATAHNELWMLPGPETNEPVLRANGLDGPFDSIGVTKAIAVARSGGTRAFLVDATPPDPSEQDDLEAQWGWATVQFTWADGTFEFVGSYAGGGTFTDTRSNRSWPITYDDLVGSGTNIERVGDELRFLDLDTGAVLVTIRDEFKNAIAEQHPEWAEAVNGAAVPDPTPPPDRRIRVALMRSASSDPVYVDLPPLPEWTPVSLIAGPDETFLVIAVTQIDRDPDGSSFSIAERTAFLVQRR